MFSRQRRILFLSLLAVPLVAHPSIPGIDNFYQVNEHVYRGAQPTSEGIVALAKMGVKLVLDLRESGGRATREQNTVETAGMTYVNVPMTGLAAPTEEEIRKILALLEDDAVGPVFVHCMRGADRTGAVIGAYRIDHDKWDNARALKEAISDGMSFFQLPRQNYIKNFRAGTLTIGPGPK